MSDDESDSSEDTLGMVNYINDIDDNLSIPGFYTDAFKRINALDLNCWYDNHDKPSERPVYPKCGEDTGGDCYGDTYPHIRGIKTDKICPDCKYVYCSSCYYLNCPRCRLLYFRGLNLEHKYFTDRYYNGTVLIYFGGSRDLGKLWNLFDKPS